MPAPGITFAVSGNKISSATGYNFITVTFASDIPYVQCEIRVTLANAEYGRGVGRLIAAFSTTPAGVSRVFEVYDTDLVSGEGEYRISIYAESEDGGWNDNWLFIPDDSSKLITSDQKTFLSMR